MRPHETALGLSLAAVTIPIGMVTAAHASGVWAGLGGLATLTAFWILWDVGDVEVPL